MILNIAVTIISTIIVGILWAEIIYNNHLQRKTQRMINKFSKDFNESLATSSEYRKLVNEFVAKQNKNNDFVIEALLSHKEALKIIVNHIRAGEERA